MLVRYSPLPPNELPTGLPNVWPRSSDQSRYSWFGLAIVLTNTSSMPSNSGLGVSNHFQAPVPSSVRHSKTSSSSPTFVGPQVEPPLLCSQPAVRPFSMPQTPE